MRCPKCHYISFDYLDNCKKCGMDLSNIRERLYFGEGEPQGSLWQWLLEGDGGDVHVSALDTEVEPDVVTIELDSAEFESPDVSGSEAEEVISIDDISLDEDVIVEGEEDSVRDTESVEGEIEFSAEDIIPAEDIIAEDDEILEDVKTADEKVVESRADVDEAPLLGDDLDEEVDAVLKDLETVLVEDDDVEETTEGEREGIELSMETMEEVKPEEEVSESGKIEIKDQMEEDEGIVGALELEGAEEEEIVKQIEIAFSEVEEEEKKTEKK